MPSRKDLLLMIQGVAEQTMAGEISADQFEAGQISSPARHFFNVAKRKMGEPSLLTLRELEEIRHEAHAYDVEIEDVTQLGESQQIRVKPDESTKED